MLSDVRGREEEKVKYFFWRILEERGAVVGMMVGVAGGVCIFGGFGVKYQLFHLRYSVLIRTNANTKTDCHY